MATKSDFKVEVPESITRSIKEPKIEKYKFKKEDVRPRNVLEEIANQMLDQSKRKMQKPEESDVPKREPTPQVKMQKPEESDAPQRQPAPQVRPEPAITEYNESQNLFDRNRQALENNKHLNFVRRVLIPESNPLALVSEDGQALETHRMAADVMEEGRLRGNWLVYPTVVERESGRLEKLNNEDARTYAVSKGEYINFGTSKDTALDFSRNYKSASPEFNNYFKDRWETRQAEQRIEKETPIVVPEQQEEKDLSSRFIPPPVQYVVSSYFKGGNKTEKDLGNDVVNELNKAAANAVRDGRNSVNYEDYGTTKRGLSLMALVGASKYADGSTIPQNVRIQLRQEREKMYPKNPIGLSRFVYDVATDPKIQAALSIGGFNIKEEDGNYFINDRYNFNTKNKSEDDWYAWIRKKLSGSKSMPLSEEEGFFTRVKLDVPSSLLARQTTGGD